MALPRKLQHQFQWALIFTLCFLTFAILPYKSAGRLINNNNNNRGKEKVMKLVLGSKPPSCINKCMNCTPCMAVLVTPPPHRKIHNSSQKSSSELTPQEEENYYLLGWKCKCKNKLFPP